MINPVPNGCQPLVAHLCMHDCAKAMDFYKKVFAAEEVMRMPGPNGKIMHAEMRIAGCMFFLADDCGQGYTRSPREARTTTVTMTMYCLDADKVFDRAVKAGAKSVQPMQDAFWGDRMGVVNDPFGHQWMLMTRKEELTMDQMMERGKKMMAGV